MKKTIAIMLVALTALTLFTACGKKSECDFCGEIKKCSTKDVFGETISICKDCIDELNDF